MISPLLALLLTAPPLQGPPTQSPERITVFLSLPVDANSVAGTYGLTLADEIPALGLVSFAVPPMASEPVIAAIVNALDAAPFTYFAERDHRSGSPEFDGCSLDGQVGVQQCTVGFVSGDPSDEAYSNQAWLTTLGVPAAQAWHASEGAPESPLVAVLDTGVDPSHPALAGVLDGNGWDFVDAPVVALPGGWDAPDGIDDDGDGLVDEAYGHGTHVAATIALVFPDARIRSYRVVGADGVGWGFNIARGLWTAIVEGAEVINLSLGMTSPSVTVEALLDLAVALGIDVYAAAGNTGGDVVLFPANENGGPGSAWVPATPTAPWGVVAVSAVDADDLPASFAALGSAVDVAAPGVGIHSAIPGALYASWDGTSMATAIATGVGALKRAVTGAPAAGALIKSATPLPTWPTLGRVDAAAALAWP